MSELRRAYDLLRGYIGHEFDRMNSVLEGNAQRELDEALEGPTPRSGPATNAVPSAPRMTDEEIARSILGVGPEADYAAIRTAFDRLNKRSDPANFPVGTPEAAQASEIQARITKAYRILSARFDGTERRFRNLEIE